MDINENHEKLRPNLCFLHSYAFALGIGVWQLCWVFAGNSQTTHIFEAKFGWDKEDTKFYNAIISTSGVIGTMAGSLIGGKVIETGRRKAALYWQVLAIVGAAITQIGTVPWLCFGRFLNGITAGIATNVMGKSLDDTVPVEASGQFGTLLNFHITLGILFAYLFGWILPTDYELMKADERWRIIYAMPAVIAIIEILLLLFVFR